MDGRQTCLRMVISTPETLKTMNPLDNLNKYSIILGSASPRRRQLLADLGIDFQVVRLNGIEEVYPESLNVDEIPVFLSQLKANAFHLAPSQLLIAADTIVVAEGNPLGKPANYSEAVGMLEMLSGKKHKVITGVTVRSTLQSSSFSATTIVDVAPLSHDEIEYYIERYKPYDKAGAYGIQEWIGCIGIRGIEGSFYNVMGLPLHRLYCELKKF